jgi:thermitase
MLAFSGVVLAQQNLPAPSKGEDDAFIPGEAEGAFVPGEILVKFKPGSPAPARADAHRQNGGQVKETIRGIDVQVVGVPPGQERAQVAAYSRNPNVEYAELNGVATISQDPDDPYDNTSSYTSSKQGGVQQWGWAKIKAYNAWDKTRGATSVKVAVVDTGIDNSHPDLPSVAAQKDFINNDSNAEDDNGHGTHVAGTIGASTNNATGVAGANWNVSLLGAKALNASGSGSYSAISNAINWSADNGATAINLSLGGSTPSLTLENAVKYAWNKGSVLACAAGNSNTSQKSYPGAYTNCIAVAATDETDKKASFSNYGSWVDVAAPGVRILSTMPNSDVYMTTQKGYSKEYDSLNGTSMATPHVAGLAALVKASGTSGASNIRNKIQSSATDRTVLSGTGPDWSKARINACKAVGGTGC